MLDFRINFPGVSIEDLGTQMADMRTLTIQTLPCRLCMCETLLESH